MGKKEKLLEKAKRAPNSLTFNDFEALLHACGWEFKRQIGSHRMWYSPLKFRLPIQNYKGKAKEYQVKQFLDEYEKES